MGPKDMYATPGMTVDGTRKSEFVFRNLTNYFANPFNVARLKTGGRVDQTNNLVQDPVQGGMDHDDHHGPDAHPHKPAEDKTPPSDTSTADQVAQGAANA